MTPTRILEITRGTYHSPLWTRMVSSKWVLRLAAPYICSIWLKRRWHSKLICRHSWCLLRNIRRLRILLWETWRLLLSRRLCTPGTCTLRTTKSWMATKSLEWEPEPSMSTAVAETTSWSGSSAFVCQCYLLIWSSIRGILTLRSPKTNDDTYWS